ncbi:MAG: pyridoxal phosphate-dependent aminotransferase [Acidobacteriota bacterium]|nr:pyridoxal phosphate-dependent aminotransferase [Acidobacteriota bacterium]
MKQSSRMAAVQTPVIPVIGRWIAETPGTISLGQGIVSWGPPPEAITALHAFPSAPGDHRYGPVEGVPSLVDALSRKLADENSIAPRGNRIIVTAGSNLAFMNAVLAVADPGDEIVLPAPYYFNHEMAIVMAGCVPVRVATDDRYQLCLDALAAAVTTRTRAIVTVSPNNPTGAIYPERDLRAVNALCRDRGIVHISDEAYEYFTYGDAAHFSAASIEGAEAWTISLYTLSKAYGMASWRVGYMVVPESLWDEVNKIQDTLLVCPPHPSQAAAVAALAVGKRWTTERMPALARMRDRAFATLSTVADVPRADGAFYYLIRAATRLDSMAASEHLIRQHRVAVIPGSAFGVNEGCALRVSFGALEEATASEGLDRLAAGLKALPR